MADIGPQLPAYLLGNRDDIVTVEEDANKGKNLFGPSLPPDYHSTHQRTQNEHKEQTNCIGPTLPYHLMQDVSSSAGAEQSDSDEENGVVIGPSPPTIKGDDTSSHVRVKEEFESRAKSMKDKLEGNTGNQVLKRESWMLELPPALSKNFGLGARSFRSQAPELGDQSVWTETPADRERKRKERRDAAESGAAKRKTEDCNIKQHSQQDLLIQSQVEEYNRQTRPHSLLEMHREKREKAEKSNLRRPFDRDRDLSITRRDPKEKAKFIDQAKTFSDKFAKGNYEKKFL